VVLVQPGSADEVGEMALNLGLQGEQMNYVPATEKVLYHTAVLQPGSSETIYFNTPNEPGTYTLVCTFPGHYKSMRTTLVVK
jgi:azurin